MNRRTVLSMLTLAVAFVAMSLMGQTHAGEASKGPATEIQFEDVSATEIADAQKTAHEDAAKRPKVATLAVVGGVIFVAILILGFVVWRRVAARIRKPN